MHKIAEGTWTPQAGDKEDTTRSKIRYLLRAVRPVQAPGDRVVVINDNTQNWDGPRASRGGIFSPGPPPPISGPSKAGAASDGSAIQSPLRRDWSDGSEEQGGGQPLSRQRSRGTKRPHEDEENEDHSHKGKGRAEPPRETDHEMNQRLLTTLQEALARSNKIMKLIIKATLQNQKLLDAFRSFYEAGNVEQFIEMILAMTSDEMNAL